MKENAVILYILSKLIKRERERERERDTLDIHNFCSFIFICQWKLATNITFTSGIKIVEYQIIV